MEKGARTQLLTAVVLVVVLGAGIVLGMAVAPKAHAPPTPEVQPATQSPDSTGRRRRTPLYMQVDPTPEQKHTLDSLLSANHEAMRGLLKEFHQEFDPRYDSLSKEYHAKYDPRYDSLISGTRAAIRKVLRPEQVVKWDSLIARADSIHAEDRRRGVRGSRDRD